MDQKPKETTDTLYDLETWLDHEKFVVFPHTRLENAALSGV